MKAAGFALALLLAACGSTRDESIEPVATDNASAARLMSDAEGAARNAEARTSAEADGNMIKQGETKR